MNWRNLCLAAMALATFFVSQPLLAQHEETIEYEVQEKQGSDTQAKHILKVIRDGDTKVMEWDGSGEMPAEMAAYLDGMEVQNEEDGHEMIIIERDVRRERSAPERMQRKHRWHAEPGHAPRQPDIRLGVMMEAGDQGVQVTDVFKNTAADNAGLQRGDVILKVDEQYIFTAGTLFKCLEQYQAGNEVTITYLREGKEMKGKGILTTRD